MEEISWVARAGLVLRMRNSNDSSGISSGAIGVIPTTSDSHSYCDNPPLHAPEVIFAIMKT